MKYLALLVALNDICEVAENGYTFEKAYSLKFVRGKGTVTVRILFEDVQSKADLVITNITTLPDSEKNFGHGSSVLQTVLQEAKNLGFEHIIATQVNPAATQFWCRNNFVRLGNPTNDFRYLGI